jgi:hypothetical protein
MPTRAVLLCLLWLLGGCLAHDMPRATPEHLQLRQRVAVVVLADPEPRMADIALQPTRSVHARLTVPGWDPRAAVEPYLASRLRGKGLEVVALDYAPTDFGAVYASSMAYPDPQRVAVPLRALAAGARADLLVVVYRQTERDFIGESVENLVGYGVVRHPGTAPQAYASVLLEAIDVPRGGLVARANGTWAAALPAEAWREEWWTGADLAPDGAQAAQLAAALTAALQGTVLAAAQEAGLSH